MKKYIIGLVFSIGCLFACTKQDRDNMIIDQEKSIDTYVTGLGSEARIVRNGGSSRIIISNGTGEEIIAGDSIIFRYAAYIFSGGKGSLFSTNNITVAQAVNFHTDGKAERKVVGGSDLLVGINNGLIGAKEGEICNIVFSGKYGYGNAVVYNVPKLSPLFFEVWIDRVIKN